jgi:glycosyltransferase involved in cell wall biosynthesis
VGEGNLRAKYESLTQQSGLGGKVIFAGNVSDEELPGFYAASDLVAVPSKDISEGFGLTVLEANASGRACIASNTGGIPEILRDGYNGLLVPPRDPQILAKGIIRLTTDDRERLRMGENGRKVAISHDWKLVAEQTETSYFAAAAESCGHRLT